ncbi:MAG: PKD domain-containing protein [Bacteroidales bacterium]|nr:PKD domain-containing protein [Bacteroidales bacterium]
MKHRLILTWTLLLSLTATLLAQQPTQDRNNPSTILFDITEIAHFDERIIFIHELLDDCRFTVTPSLDQGLFTIEAKENGHKPLQECFEDFRFEHESRYLQLDKYDAASLAKAYKTELPDDIVLALSMDIYIKSRQNNHCADADPFCTDNGMYEFPAGVNAGNGESGPNYDCLHSTPNPAWYYMKIANPGGMTIYMYSTPEEDIDFCCWGPFNDPVTPCPNGLTLAKRVSCSYSAYSTETCNIPTSAQTGDYYIMVITNYSNHSCNIHFSKTGGSGTTDCSILPPLVDNDGPFCVGETIHLTGNAQNEASYSWSGPGGWTATGQNVTRPNCTLDMAGTYTCTITVGNQSNSATTEVIVAAQPTSNFQFTTECQGTPTQFTSTATTNPSGQPITRYQWNFGDGNRSAEPNPSHLYAEAGTYNVTLTVSCGNQTCSHTVNKNVTVNALPQTNAGQDQTISYGATARLNGSAGTGNFTYHWEPANMVTNPNEASTQTVALTQNQTFTLTATNIQGNCTSSDEVTVHISGSAMTASASANPSTICHGESTQLLVTVGGGTGNFTYSWTPTLGLGDPHSANPVAYPSETTTYSCHVSDGQTTQDVTVTVTVNEPESVEEDVFVCSGEPYEFHGQTLLSEGDYRFDTLTSQGCNKTITLHLHHYPVYDETVFTEFICEGDSYDFFGIPYNYTCQPFKILESEYGCDSIVRLHLTVYPPNDTLVVDPTICISQSYDFHGMLFSNDGDIAYFDTIDQHGCLKVEKLILAVGPYQMPPVENRYECYGHDETPYFRWDKNGLEYYADALDEIILPDPEGGCDIKYRLNLQFHQEFYNEETIEACDEYVWPVTGERFTATNHHLVKTFDSGGGNHFNCDSTYVLDLSIHHSYNGIKTVSNQCDDYVWEFGWNHETYQYTDTDPNNVWTRTIPTSHGCDSTVTLQLQLDYSPDFSNINGKSWVVGGSEFQYTIEKYGIHTLPTSTHLTEWYFSDPDFNRWQIVPYGLSNDSCLLYIFTFEQDSIELCAKTHGPCGEFVHSKWIHCSFHGLQESRPNVDVQVFPNPNDGDMTLAFENIMGNVQVKVFNQTGVLVDQFQVQNTVDHQAHRHQVPQLPPGVYFFSFSSKEGILTRKVVVLK